MIKNLKKPCVFPDFWLHIALHKAQETQESTLKPPKQYRDPKRKNPTLKTKHTKCQRQLGSQFLTQKHTKKTITDLLFKTPFPRISGIQIMPRQKVNERCKKRVLTGIILYKRKGGIRPYKTLPQNPAKADKSEGGGALPLQIYQKTVQRQTGVSKLPCGFAPSFKLLKLTSDEKNGKWYTEYVFFAVGPTNFCN